MATGSTSPRALCLRAAHVAGVAAIALASAVAVLGCAASPGTTQVARGGSVIGLVASIRHEVEHAPCPPNMAHVGNSCVDRYEASLVEVHDDGSESAFSPFSPPNGLKVRAVSRPSVVPQAHISMVEAKRACSASGKRLCRANEWKTACKGPEATRYPYGNKRVPGACVDTNRRSPMMTLYPTSTWSMNDPRANQLAHTVEKTGATTSCTNGYGISDIVGNVHEWTDDGSFRGGYYLDTKQNGEGCDYRTTAHAPIYYDYSTGFRCCADEGTLPDDET